MEEQLRGVAGLADPDADRGALARFDVEGPGLVQVLPIGPETVVDGSAPTVAGLAAAGALEPARPLFYAADRSPAQLRAAAEAGADLVIGDSGRLRVNVPAQTRQEAGATVSAAGELPPGSAELQPFPDAGTEERTVAEYDGVRDVREDVLPAVRQFPEQRPFAALDGDEATSWVAPDHPDESRHWLEVEFDAPRDVPSLELLPHADAQGRTVAVEIAGEEYAVGPGPTTLRPGLRGVTRLRIGIAEVERAAGVDRAAGGIAELRIPGVDAREWLRPPVRLERALAGADLDRSSLAYVFERTTAAAPFDPRPGRGVPQRRRLRDGRDAERQIARRIAPPAARTWSADGWAVLAPAADAGAASRCGALVVRMGTATLRLRGETTGAGRVRLLPCGEPAELPAGPVDVTTEGTALRPVWLRLLSGAPDGLPAPSGGGDVVAEGDAEHARARRRRGQARRSRLARAGPELGPWLAGAMRRPRPRGAGADPGVCERLAGRPALHGGRLRLRPRSGGEARDARSRGSARSRSWGSSCCAGGPRSAAARSPARRAPTIRPAPRGAARRCSRSRPPSPAPR